MPGSSPPSHRGGLARITATAFLWGASGVVVRLVHDAGGLTPQAIGFFRLLVAGALLLVVTRPSRVLMAMRVAPVALVLAGVGLAAFQALYFVSVADVGVSVSTLVSLGVAPLVTAVWEVGRRRSAPSARSVLTLVVALAGLALVARSTPTSHVTAPRPVAGLLAAVACGVVYAGVTVLTSPVTRRVAPLPVTAVTSAVGALALAPWLVLGGPVGPVPARSVVELVLLGVIGTGLAYVLFYSGLRSVTSDVASLVTLLEPVVAAVLAVIVLHEGLTTGTVVGGPLMLLAVAALYVGPAPVLDDTA